MVSIIIGIAVIVTVFILFTKEDKEHKGFIWTLSILSGVLVFGIVESFALCVFRAAAVTTTDATAKVATVELVALQDNSATTGQFFLGSGSVDNKAYYAFYYKTPNGFKYETLDAESAAHPVYIKYLNSNTESPRIDRYGTIRKKVYTATANPLWFSVLAALEYGNAKTGDVISEETLETPPLFSSGDIDYNDFRYEIIVPQGSIQQNYTIDLQ